jgi:signal transduction histidine kinase
VLHDTYDEMTEDEIQDLVNTALSSGNHMINLLNDILNISKDRHLEHLISRDEVAVKQLVLEPVESLKEVAASQSIEMKCHISEFSSTSVVTDKSKVQQIISNIVSNAIKFAAGGRIAIDFGMAASMPEAVDQWAERASTFTGTVFTMHEDDLLGSVDAVRREIARLAVSDDKKWLLISVEDSGCGMRESELGEMLKPYRQSSRGTNRTFQGTGLGLFICVSLCQQLKGYIGCSSTPGVGTLFHVGIPVEDKGDAKANASADKIPAIIGDSARKGKSEK